MPIEKLAYSEQVERIVLSTPLVLQSVDAFNEIAGKIGPDDFVLDRHKGIFESCKTVSKEKNSLAIQLVALDMVARGIANTEMDAMVQLSCLIDGIPAFHTIDPYVRELKEFTTRRQIAHLCNWGGRESTSETHPTATLDEIVNRALKLKDGLTTEKDYVSADDAVTRTLQDLENQWANPAARGIKTGFDYLDAYLHTLQPGRLYVLGARPGLGKTALGLNVGCNVARIRPEAVVLMLSLEMNAQELTIRCLSSFSGINSELILSGALTKEERHKLMQAANDISALKLTYLEPRTKVTPLTITTLANKIKQQYGRLDLVIVDYIQLVRGDGRYTSANNEVNDITRAFKAYALSANVPVLALSQLNRASSRENRRPQLHDLRDSGGIEQDADVVMFIHDPEIEENIRELIIDKNRAGRLGSIKLKFIPEQIRFESIGEIEFANDHNSQPALGANGD